MTRQQIAEDYLRLVTAGDPHARMYVRLAAENGVPFGRIVNLTSIPAEVVAAHLEGAE